MSATAFQRRRREQAAKVQTVEHKETGTRSIEQMTYQELKALAKEKDIKGFNKMKKVDLIKALSELEKDNLEDGEIVNKIDGKSKSEDPNKVPEGDA